MQNPNKPIIGKDVIESLTLGMYEDCRFIFREYVQNAADQIDKALKENLLNKEEAAINIQIDFNKKFIQIEDNATGIRSSEVVEILQNIAQSTKQRGVDKGFRGIGRLGGLAYCDKLIFETSFEGEDEKSILIWDAKLLKEILNNRSIKEEAIEVITKVTIFKKEKEVKNKHYFKVMLTGVTNNTLLDKDNIIDYLSMVAPVPFPNGFVLKSSIYEKLKIENLSLDEYNIYVNHDKLFKSYTTSLYEELNGSKRIFDKIYELIFFEHFIDNTLLYWGWYGISNFEKQIDKCNYSRGIRLRKANIQVGSDDVFVDFFREPRGTYYFFGEVHAFHPDLIPNARRDYFLDNSVTKLFENKLKEFFHNELHRLYYDASKIRNANKRIKNLVDFQKEFEKKEEAGFVNKEEKEELIKEFESKKEEAYKAKKELDKISNVLNEKDNPIKKIYDRVVDTNNISPESIKVDHDKKTLFVADKISSLNKEQRKFLSRIFSIIRTVLNKDSAEELIKRIEEELK